MSISCHFRDRNELIVDTNLTLVSSAIASTGVGRTLRTPRSWGASWGLMLRMKKISFLMFFNRPTRQNPGYATESCS